MRVSIGEDVVAAGEQIFQPLPALAEVALHFAYYNLVKIHRTIRCTPAMEAGVVDDIWAVSDLVALAK